MTGPAPDATFPRLNAARRRAGKAVQAELAHMRDDLSVVGEAVGRELVHIQHEMEEVRRWVVTRLEDAPMHNRVNQFIKTGYRVHTRSLWDCVASAFALHNETVNIWSHVIGLLIFLALGAHTLATTDFKHPSDLAMYSLFFVSAAVMFLTSSLYHTFSCHSEHVCGNLLMCDYLGIFIMILGSTTSAYQVAFYCNDTFRTAYQASTFLSCMLGIVMLAVPYFNRAENFIYRLVTYVVAVGMSIVPVFHVASQHGVSEVLPWLGILVLYGAGLFFYVTRFPECIWPGRFDLVLNSHQLWHLFIIFAALQTFYAIHTAYRTKVAAGTCAAC